MGKRARQFAFAAHDWVGLKLAVLMSFILITGTLATLSHEIDWLINPDMRVAPQAESGRASWGALYDAAVEARPDWTLDRIEAPIDPWFAAQAWGVTPLGERRRLHLNPYTAEVTGESGWANAQRVLRDAHRRLMIFHPLGVTFVSLFAVALAVSLVSGLIIYKKFWRGFFKPVRTRDARTLWGDLHRLGGIWSIWFVALMALTGAWYLVESLGARAGAFEYEGAREIAVAAAPLNGARIDAFADQARAAFPELEIRRVVLPARPAEAIEFAGQAEAILVRDRANAVRVDPSDGRIAGVLQADRLGVHQRISEMADPLHFGTFAGLVSKLVYFVFGMILSGLSLSGVYIYSARLRRRAAPRRARPAPAAAAERG